MLRTIVISAAFFSFILVAFFTSGNVVFAEEDFPVDLFTLDCNHGNEADEEPWCVGIYASYYGAVKGKKYYGCLDNLLHPRDDYFVALPSKKDSLDCLDGKLRVRLSDESAAFRVIEIKPHGEEAPVFEVTVEDIGPWYCGDDPYWVTGTRPASEDGIDGRGRRTNGAGIDLSYRLAQDLGIDGIGQVDWRFKKVDGEYIFAEKVVKFRR